MAVQDDSKVTKASREEQATDILRRRIVSGQVAANERLVENELASDFDLSRSTIRVALRRLMNEELVRHVPYFGYRVVTLESHDIWEIETLRSTLEGLGARLAAENIDKAGERSLRYSLSRLIKSAEDGKHAKANRLDFELHELIVSQAGNQRLINYYHRIANQFQMYISMSNQSVTARAIADSHRKLVDAICAGDGPEAERLTHENVEFRHNVPDQVDSP